MAYDKDGEIVALTHKQIEQYVESGCIVCPFCGFTELENGQIENGDAMYAYRNVNCPECEHEWTERFEVESIA